MEVTQELKRELVYDPAIPLLSIYPKNTETLIQKYLGTYIYTCIHTHTHTQWTILLSHEKNEIPLFETM